MGEFYVYIHLRADSGLPFYIGKGKGKRKGQRTGRGEHWERVARKHGVIVDLLHTGLSEEAAFRLEMEEIAWAKQYYEIVNHTDGGEGITRSEQTGEKKRAILEFFENNLRFPSILRPEEKPLRIALNQYSSPSQGCFDPEFRDRVVALGYAEDTSAKRKADIVGFFAKHGRFPSIKKTEEAHLRASLNAYCSPSQHTYDPAFRFWAESLGYGTTLVEEHKQELRDFYERLGRLPSQSVSEERHLYSRLIGYCCEGRHSFDPEFRSWAASVGYGKRTGRPRKTKP